MLSEDKKIIPLLANTNYGGGVDMDSFKGYGKSVTVIMLFGAVTGNAVLTVNSGATAGTKTSTMPFRIANGGGAIGAASADVLSAWTASNASSQATLTGATFTTKMGILEIPLSGADTANNEEWITISLSNAASSGILYAAAVVDCPRYTGNRSTTLLA